MKPIECLRQGLPLDQADPVQPMDLTAADFVALIEFGLTKGDIQALYHFKHQPAYYTRLKALGLHPLPDEVQALAKLNTAQRNKDHMNAKFHPDLVKSQEQPISFPRPELSHSSPPNQIIIRLVKGGKVDHMEVIDGDVTAQELLELAREYDGVSIPSAQGRR